MRRQWRSTAFPLENHHLTPIPTHIPERHGRRYPDIDYLFIGPCGVPIDEIMNYQVLSATVHPNRMVALGGGENVPSMIGTPSGMGGEIGVAIDA